MSFSPRSLPQFPPSQHAAERPDGLGGHSWAQHPALPCPPPSPYPLRGAQGARGQRGCWLAPLLAPCRPPDGTAGKSHTPHRAGRERASCAAEPRRGGLGDTPELGTRGRAGVTHGGQRAVPLPCRNPAQFCSAPPQDLRTPLHEPSGMEKGRTAEHPAHKKVPKRLPPSPEPLLGAGVSGSRGGRGPHPAPLHPFPAALALLEQGHSPGCSQQLPHPFFFSFSCPKIALGCSAQHPILPLPAVILVRAHCLA